MGRLALNSVIVRFISVLLLILAVPFSIVLIVTTSRLSAIERENANQYLSSNLRTVASTMDQALMNLEDAHTLMYIDTQFMNGLKRLAPYDSREEYSDFKNTNAIKSCINGVAAINDYIQSIYAYSFTAERMFSSRTNWSPSFNHFKTTDAEWLENYERRKLERPWQITRAVDEQLDILTCYREVWIYGADSPIGLLAVNVNTEDITRMLREVIPGGDGCAFILDDRGNVLSERRDSMSDVIIEKLPDGQSEGFFGFSHDGGDMFASYYTSAYTGFKFVVSAPMNQIQTSISVMTPLIILFAALLALMLVVALALAYHLMWRPVMALFAEMRRVQNGDFTARLPESSTYEFGYINSNFNSMVDNIRRLIDENYASRLINQEAKLKNIQDQLNEHFLYNTLDSIHWLARKENAQQASDMVFALANFYRTSLSCGKDVIPVRDVTQMIENYLYIQKIRLRDAFRYRIDCDEELLEQPMPKGLLQPLVENALVHGMKGLDRPGMLVVCIERRDSFLRISVTDNGVGFTQERLEEVCRQLAMPQAHCEHSFALKTLQSQFRLYYHVDSDLHIETSPNQGTVVWFEAPLTVEEV